MQRRILLVEDDKVDAMTVKRALHDIGAAYDLVHVRNGEEALEHLRTPGHAKPTFMLVDLNMPRMNGLELLETLKSDCFLRDIPVVVLTTSRNERDIQESYRLGASGYIVKQANYEGFKETIKIVVDYWSLSETAQEEMELSYAGVNG